MPQNQRSLSLTNAYRRRLLAIGNRVELQARELWPRIEEFDSTPWVERMAQIVTRAQVEGVRLTAGYLTAFLRSETGRGTAPAINSAVYAGVSRDGRPLAEALESPLIGVRAALKQGKSPAQALAIGLQRGTRMTKFEVVDTARNALLDAVEADERLDGWERSVQGTCAACMAFSGQGGPQFEVHPECCCIPQPKAKGVVDRFPLPTGAALFSALSKTEQDAKIGPDAAALVRDGNADLQDFVSHSKIETQDDFITQKPATEVA